MSDGGTRNGLRYYIDRNVFEAGLDRMRFIFDEFDDVIVHTSGGKDSTVCIQLALIVARERNRLPLKLMFVDQEVEHSQTIDQMMHDMESPEIEPLWIQVPYEFENGTSTECPMFTPWDEEVRDVWMRPKREGNPYTENVYKTRNFYKMFDAFCQYHFGDRRVARIGGVRCEESPNRRLALTVDATYKWATWGKVPTRKTKEQHILFYPIYDWSYQDVWKAIHDNGWQYNELYDLQYQHGVPVQIMRVSSIIHETAIHGLMYLQEVDTEFWPKLCKRVPGVASAGILKEGAFRFANGLPYMFATWREYADYLLEHLVIDPEQKERFRVSWGRFESGAKVAGWVADVDWDSVICAAEARTVLVGDCHGNKLNAVSATKQWNKLEAEATA